jgi:SAM-dependent methyltransferase
VPFRPSKNQRVAETLAAWPAKRQARLQEFVAWRDAYITGDEKGEAQIFLDRLFQAFEQKGCLEVGGHPEFRVRNAAASGRGTSFADYVWKPVVLIEMKRRGENLAKHYRQAFDYWVRLVPNRPIYVVLCNFDEFWIFDFNNQMDAPVDRLRIDELPTRFGPLAFLFPNGETPTFGNDHVAVTREAASALASCYQQLSRREIPSDLVRHFILQMLVALFSEDIGLLPPYLIPHLLEDCTSPERAYDLIGDLFEWMNTPGVVNGGRYKGVPYFNGGLFVEPARIELVGPEISLLKKAATFDWSKVSPDIFGTIFESSLVRSERHAYGAYFTSPIDIMKIVGPTIVDPWRSQIEAARSIRDLDRLLERMTKFRVLDPACGSGNFLYVAYRELKRLEARIYERRGELGRSKQGHLRFVSTQQFYGIDVNPFAVELAKVTLMIAHKLVIDELKIDESPLPLANLDANFLAGDALIENHGHKRIWPDADVIIGNPPFLGAKRMKPERGKQHVDALRRLYPEVPAMADYCVYWFRRAHDHLPLSTSDDPLRGRAGLVGTQNIRSNQSRVGGLDHITSSGVITEAVDNQPWSGDSAVHVAIVNWVKPSDSFVPPEKRKLWTSDKKSRGKLSNHRREQDGLVVQEVSYIGASLTAANGVAGREETLSCNQQPKRCFQGKIPGYDGFLLNREQVSAFLPDCAAVIAPYITGRELLGEFRIERWIIDFGARDMLEAATFQKAFDHCRQHVLPEVEATYERVSREDSDMKAARKEHLGRWWQLWNRRDELSAFLRSSERYLACSRVTRRPIVVFLSSKICPSDLVQVFALADDYSFGVLQSTAHFQWFRRKSSRLKVESDLRYSVRDVFETFPWPQGDQFVGPSPNAVERVISASRDLQKTRSVALKEIHGGLRAIYRTLELPGKTALRDAHEALDDAVRTAYGFSGASSDEEQLAHLNRAVAERIRRDEEVVSPGPPPSYPDVSKLITDDCYGA